ncbi:MAG TPA: AAA family ATPase [Actinoplanes sp.]|nr:AAA family ATPase [Actinoplanes sp.]
MADYFVLINGLPGSGKTTLANQLAPALDVPVICKDVLKEAMAAALPGIPTTAFGAVAGEALWDLAAATPGLVILESWWFKPRDLGYVQDGLRRCASPAVEIWCDVPAALARERFRTRRRAALHDDERHLVASWPRWEVEAEPLGVAAKIMVKTDRQTDVAALVGEISTVLDLPRADALR